MKKIFKFSLLLLSLVFFGSCEEDLVIFETPDGFIQLAATSGSIEENNTGDLITTVLFGGRSNDSGITANFTVTSSDPSRFTVSPASGTLEIPAGQMSADIVLTPVDNFDVDGNASVTITLTDASSKPIGIGGEGLRNVSTSLTIIDNDCPITIDDWVGTYTVFENFTDGVNAPSGLSDFFTEAYQIELALAPGDITGTKVVITNTPGFNEYIADGTVMSFDTCNAKVSFDAGFPTVALFRTFEFTDSSYDESNFVIQCTGPLATFGPYQFTFTKQ